MFTLRSEREKTVILGARARRKLLLLRGPTRRLVGRSIVMSLTALLDLAHAEVDDDGPDGGAQLDERGEVDAEHVPEVLPRRLAVAGHELGALLVHVQLTVCGRRRTASLSLSFSFSRTRRRRFPIKVFYGFPSARAYAVAGNPLTGGANVGADVVI